MILFHELFLECGLLRVAHGAVNDTRVVYGTVVQVTCYACFNLQGDGIARCKQDGRWDFSSSCIPKGKTIKHVNTDYVGRLYLTFNFRN